MSNQTPEIDDLELEKLFLEAQAEQPEVSPALLDAIVADATAVANDRKSVAPKSRWWLSDVFLNLGGWPAVGGMVTAAVTGVWFGLNPFVSLADFGSDVLMSEADIYLTEMFQSSDLSVEDI